MLPPVGSTQLANGRFAMIDDGIGFQRVPWRPVLDKRIGQNIGCVMRNVGGTEWSFGAGLELLLLRRSYEGPRQHHLLVAMGPDRCPSGQGWRTSRAPRFAAGGLDRTPSGPAGARHTGKVK